MIEFFQENPIWIAVLAAVILVKYIGWRWIRRQMHNDARSRQRGNDNASYVGGDVSFTSSKSDDGKSDSGWSFGGDSGGDGGGGGD